MVAYAAVISLLHTLDGILEPDGPPIAHEKIVVESLREQVRILLDFVENYSAYKKIKELEVESLEKKIREVAWKAEDVVESHICGRLLSRSPNDLRFGSFLIAHALFWGLVWEFIWNRKLTRIPFLEQHLTHNVTKHLYCILCFLSAFFTCYKHVEVENELPLAIRRLFYLCVFERRFQKICAAPITFMPYDSKLGEDQFRGVMDDISSTVREVVRIKEVTQLQNVLPFDSPSKRRRRPSGRRTCKNVMLGLGDDLIEIKTLLASDSSGIKIVPIVGMGGIGKTTLARQVYNDAYIVHHFYIRAWVTVSQEYSLRQVLLGLLDSAKLLTEDMLKESEAMLFEHLYKSLKGKRYLIVLDDVWDIEIWDKMRLSFPEDHKGSRVLLTTRLNNVALHANPCSPLHEMRCLSQNDSWDLLCSKVFGKDEGCPEELEGVGKEILQNCGGLPLTIVVISGVLSKLRRTIGSWRRVADNLSSIFTEDGEHCMRILLLSYDHLPPHLRACFLYMGVFIEAYDILVDKLIQLWAAEGFLRPSRGESLEELAEAYLEELIERNLIVVSNRTFGGKIKTCNIHDLLRNLCVQQSKKENFLHVKESEFDVIEGDGSTRRLSVHPVLLSFHSRFNYIKNTQNAGVRTFLCTGAGFTDAPRVYLGYGLLRVLDLLALHLLKFPFELFMLVHLRYLALTCNDAIPPSIINLRKLQTLIHYNSTYPDLPMGIWMMSKLRHLCVSPAYLPGPHWQIIEKNSSLEDLQRLSSIRNFKCHKHLLGRIPNLKQLEILYDDSAFLAWPEYQLEDLVNLQKLEILKLSFTYPPTASEIVYPPMLAFPHKLKKLTLSGSGIPWDDMTMVGALENLQVLKLRRNACRGTEWRPVEGQFCKLQYLLLEDVELVIWEADGMHFPILEHLVIRSCCSLDEIPSGIGEIPTLQMIDLVNCNLSVVDSAKKIQEEQESMGNEDLKLYVDSRRPSIKKFYSAPRTDSDDVMEILNAEIKRSLELHSGVGHQG